ncbi:MAG: biotin/lipoyl-binding protein [Methylococcales bacterium]
MATKTCIPAVVQQIQFQQKIGLESSFKNRQLLLFLNFSFLLMIIALLLSGCSKTGDAPAAAPGGPGAPVPNVKIAQPLNQQTTEWHEYTGRIEAVNSVEVRARVSGYLEKVNFVAGAKVNKGDLLFLIDAKPFKAQLNFAESELNQAKTKQELAKNDLTRAQKLIPCQSDFCRRI